jgi:hypothetical protein
VEQEFNAPYSGKADEGIKNSRDDIAHTAENACDQIILKYAYQPLVKRPDDDQDQCECIHSFSPLFC